MKFIDRLLRVEDKNRNILQIIIWWEIRRILYNLIVIISGFISLAIFIIALSETIKPKPGEDLFEPILIPILIPIFGILCNLGYTFGWITEIFVKRNVTYGPNTFKQGLYFTLFWMYLPAGIGMLIAITHLIRKFL